MIKFLSAWNMHVIRKACRNWYFFWRREDISVIYFQTTCCNSDFTGWCVLFVDYGTAHNKQCSGILLGVSCHLTTHSPWKRSPCFYWLLMAILPTNIKDKTESLAVRGRRHWEQAQVIWFYQCRKSWERRRKLLQCHSNIRHLASFSCTSWSIHSLVQCHPISWLTVERLKDLQ